uniref:NPHP4 Ig-like domain-containing protein n=2 Tax=Chromera velia CCMP2878 TaxID=1169474 RepID=A0A0K6SAA6_9ALVE|eukprot:Cvel_34687.t1-p1 / transcript=Cvel_34687.t1 / gene=Cvel_34687 / organism=Chromera_velia_CCMP2878 / gene_product=hypothetical protein / transcript_product=hypothetical protein / location=Cvel_scaffold6039:2450-3756(-) / protein_length=240 / sequence_SO=supercontig / SO=protein_coding / is_pseudo=false
MTVLVRTAGGLPRPVRFFTTDSWLAVVSDPPLGEAAKVSPLASTEFRLTVTPYRQGLSRCRVHALDALTGELLNAWILSVDALPPAVRDCHTIYAQRGRISRHTVPFRSPLSYDATIHLSTSDPLILQASSPFRIAGNGQCDMELFVCLDEYTLNLSQQLFAVNALEARRQREVGRGPFGTGVRTNGQEDSSFGGPPWVGWHPGGLGRGPASVEVYLFLRSRDGELQVSVEVVLGGGGGG